jgi:hypothetical protein
MKKGVPHVSFVRVLYGGAVISAVSAINHC